VGIWLELHMWVYVLRGGTGKALGFSVAWLSCFQARPCPFSHTPYRFFRARFFRSWRLEDSLNLVLQQSKSACSECFCGGAVCNTCVIPCDNARPSHKACVPHPAMADTLQLCQEEYRETCTWR